MSGIEGSCSESPANILFEKGIQETQARHAELKSEQLESGDSISTTSASHAQEGLKGMLFDAFA